MFLVVVHIMPFNKYALKLDITGFYQAIERQTFDRTLFLTNRRAKHA